jgi:hypothetical protein
LSIFKQHVAGHAFNLKSALSALDEHQRKMLEETAEDSRKASIAKRILGRGHRKELEVCSSFKRKLKRIREKSIRNSVTRRQELDLEQKSSELRENTKELKQAAYIATRSIYVLLAGLPVIGILLGLAISWNTMGIELYSGILSPAKH